MNEEAPWKISLHGGHSGEFCGHARGTLRESIEAALAFGYRTYGVAEHVARTEDRFLHPEEIAAGWDAQRLVSTFGCYAREVRRLAVEFDGRISVLCGFEADCVPAAGYAALMTGYRNEYAFDYVVGSVHYVDEVLIDGHQAAFDLAFEMQGGLEALCDRYYKAVAAMAGALKPEVFGHVDVIRKRAPGPCDTPRIRRGAAVALESIRAHGCILDVNTGGFRKGHGMPYPAPWLLELARDLGIPMCFGDDSHAPGQVGADLERTRQYLLDHGVDSITSLVKRGGGLDRDVVPLR